MAGAIIQPGARIGCNVLVNTRAVVEHDCMVGDHAHIAPGAFLLRCHCRSAKTPMSARARSFCVGVNVGAGSVVAAGAVVARTVEPGYVRRQRPGISA